VEIVAYIDDAVKGEFDADAENAPPAENVSPLVHWCERSK
jgi:hypothetical protein